MKNTRKILPIIIGCIFVAGYFMLSEGNTFKKYEHKNLTIADTTLVTYIADTPMLRAHGLSGTSSLPKNSAMLFIFEKKDSYQFWMKDMNYPLDFVWIDDSDGVFSVADLTPDVSPVTYPQTFSAKVPVRYILEVPAGTIQKEKWSIGTTVEISS